MIVTSVNVAMELSNRQDLSVFVPGGFMRPSWFSLSAGHNPGHPGFPYRQGVHRRERDSCGEGADRGNARRRRSIASSSSRPGAGSWWRPHQVGAVFQAAICPTAEVNTIITDSDATDEAIRAIRGDGNRGDSGMKPVIAPSLMSSPDRPEIDLNGSWAFALDPDDAGVAEGWFDRELADAIRRARVVGGTGIFLRRAAAETSVAGPSGELRGCRVVPA